MERFTYKSAMGDYGYNKEHDFYSNEVKNQLGAVEDKLEKAEKCLYDIETYFQLNSVGMSYQVLMNYRNGKEDEENTKQQVLPEVGSTVWVVERDEDATAVDVTGYILIGLSPTAAFCTGRLNGSEDLDYIMGDLLEATQKDYTSDVAVFPIEDVFKTKDEAVNYLVTYNE